MFDTHCHLNFKAFKKNLDEVVSRAHKSEVKNIVVPGTDVKTSKRGVEIVANLDGVYAAVGIHPHHVYKYLSRHPERSEGSHKVDPSVAMLLQDDITTIESLLSHPKVVAVGEIGLDNHTYENTVYQDYQVDLRFLGLQKELFQKQIDLTIKFKKSLILHNREARDDFLQILREKWVEDLEYRTVFHCCEPDEILLEFAKEHHIFIGVDGDITYSKKKQEFIKKVPLGMLVLETDSPFLLPEPLKSEKKYPNEPANIAVIAKFISQLSGIDIDDFKKNTTNNARRLFSLS